MRALRAWRSSVVSHAFELIVFDLDGTLVDSRRDIADAANELLEACGAERLPETGIGHMVGDGAATLVARAFEARGIERPPDALERFLALYDRRLLNHTRPYPGMAGVLDMLGQLAQLAVLTNKPIASTRRILAGLDLARHFPEDAVIGGDGPFPRKPDAGGLRHLIERAGVGAETTLLVGDSVIDWRVARAASTPVCLARYGFGFESFPLEDLGPGDRTIDAPADLLAL
jgi:phosphoglycolate phosphatase